MLLPALLTFMGVASSCNSKTETTDEVAVTVSTVAIKNFNLKADTKVLNKLDSVFFSIDLNRGVIFNADSLPKGTNITKLIPVITFTTGMSKAEIVMSGGSEESKTVNYLENPNDSIDFSRDVTLNVTAADGVNNYTYRIKVNVHEQEPDSMMWDKMAVADLPSRLPKPKAQKCVDKGGKAYSIISESDNSLTLSVSNDLFKSEWTKQQLSLPFTPDIASLDATDENLWILDSDGALYSSTDGKTWTATGEKWQSIIGPYGDCVLGIKDTPSGLSHCHYPAKAGIADPAVDPEFPLSGRSAFKTIETQWAVNPTGLFIGGVKPDGSFSSATWAFDGNAWVVLNADGIPAMNGTTMVKYVIFKETSLTKPTIANNIWLAIGGKLADGSNNRTLYYSPDNGITWKRGSQLMQLPDYFPELYGADAIVSDASLDADLSDAWTRAATRSGGTWQRPPYTIDGVDITWKCPYIYIIGGTDPSGALSDTIWRGVLARLAFTPII